MPDKFLCRNWTDSLKVNALDAYAERFFIRLMMRCDDFGIFHAEPLLLKSALFPLLPDIRPTDITRWLAACEQAGLLRCYVAANCRKYCEVLNFKQRRQFMKSEHPPPEGQIGLPLSEPKNFVPPARSRSRSRREEKEKHTTENEHDRPTCAPPSPSLETKNGEINGQGGASVPASIPETPIAKIRRQMWQLLNDESAITTRINKETEKQKPDPEMIASLKKARAAIREEMKATTPC